MTLSLLPRSCAALVAVAAVALPVAGCGGSSAASAGDAGADPAASLPASAPVYVEAQLRPQGAQRTGAIAVGRKLLRTDDPAAKLIGLFDRAVRAQGTNFERDIAPWLGNRAGVAVTSLSGTGRPGWVAAIASRDDDKAKAFVSAQQQRHKAAEHQYRGVSYGVDPKDGTAAAVVDHAVLLGTEPAVKSAIDATKGNALSEAKAFQEARGAVGSDGLAYVYLDPSRVFGLVFSRLSGAAGGAGLGAAAQSQALSGLVAGSGVRSIAASLDAAPNALRVDAAVLGAKNPGARAGDGPAAAAAVPADAWLGAGIGDVGGTLRKALARQGGGGGALGGFSIAQVEALLQQRLGIDLEHDFLSWMGDAAVFVRGSSRADLGGAVVITSKNPAASRAAIGKLDKLLTTFGKSPRPLRGVDGAEGLVLGGAGGRPTLEIAAKDDKFVVALGNGALEAALGGGGQRLGDTGAYKSAVGLLEGVKPSLFLDTPSAVKVLESFAGDRPRFRRAKPTLDVFGPAAAGLERRGDVTHVKVAVGIR
jgi:hypothetical protein